MAVKAYMHRSEAEAGHVVTFRSTVPDLAVLADRHALAAMTSTLSTMGERMASMAQCLLMERVAAGYALCTYLGRLHGRKG